MDAPRVILTPMQERIKANKECLFWWRDAVFARRRTRGTRLIVDTCMERAEVPSLTALFTAILGHAPASLDELKGVSAQQVWAQIQEWEKRPPTGAGGLGVVAGAIKSAARRHGPEERLNFSLLCHSLVHQDRRKQTFKFSELTDEDLKHETNKTPREVRKQRLRFDMVPPTETDLYSPLGEMFDIGFGSGWLGVETFHCGPLSRELTTAPGFALDLRYHAPPYTGVLYPHFASKEVLQQMVVLGKSANEMTRQLGIMAPEGVFADLFTFHDGHSAIFHFELFIYFLQQSGGNITAALQKTQAYSALTTHAPQGGTVPKINLAEFAEHYGSSKQIQILRQLGEERDGEAKIPFPKDRRDREHLPYPSALRISQVLAGQNNGVVSGLHLLVSKEAIADGNTALFPTKITANPDQLQMHPDTLDVEDWIGAAVSMVLDKHVSGWRDNPNLFTDQALIRRLRTNVSFLKDLAEALSAQDEKFLELFPLLPLEFPDVVIGPKDCVLASARRLTTYKGQLLKAVLEEVEALEAIAGKIGRRIFVLIGGVAHQNDNGAQRLLWQLLEIQEKVNKKQGQVVMNFLRDWSYAKAPHIFSGLGRRGVWGAWSDPFGPGKEQNTEAFGPSALKAMMFFMYLIGAHDGGAKVLETCPTVELYGPPSVIGGRCVLAKTWGNPERQRQSRGFLVDGALAAAEKQFRRVDKDLDCYEAGEGHLSRGLPDKVVSFAEAAGRFNNSRIMKAYLGIVDEREKAAA